MSIEDIEPSRAATTEQTPLLRDADPTGRPEEAQEPAPKETSTRELIIILGSIWLGVFLAALGV